MSYTSGRNALGPSNKPTPLTLTKQHLAKHDAHTSLKDQDVYSVGEKVLVGGVKEGLVAYVGEVKFAAGQWVGVILDTGVGKNDGSIDGVRYFQCKPLHGIFFPLKHTKDVHKPVCHNNDFKKLRDMFDSEKSSDKSSQKSPFQNSKKFFSFQQQQQQQQQPLNEKQKHHFDITKYQHHKLETSPQQPIVQILHQKPPSQQQQQPPLSQQNHQQQQPLLQQQSLLQQQPLLQQQQQPLLQQLQQQLPTDYQQQNVKSEPPFIGDNPPGMPSIPINNNNNNNVEQKKDLTNDTTNNSSTNNNYTIIESSNNINNNINYCNDIEDSVTNNNNNVDNETNNNNIDNRTNNDYSDNIGNFTNNNNYNNIDNNTNRSNVDFVTTLEDNSNPSSNSNNNTTHYIPQTTTLTNTEPQITTTTSANTTTSSIINNPLSNNTNSISNHITHFNNNNNNNSNNTPKPASSPASSSAHAPVDLPDLSSLSDEAFSLLEQTFLEDGDYDPAALSNDPHNNHHNKHPDALSLPQTGGDSVTHGHAPTAPRTPMANPQQPTKRTPISTTTTTSNTLPKRKTSVSSSTSSSSNHRLHNSNRPIRVGKMVEVGGSKGGLVRYVGETDFAKGDWVGIELKQPIGKNDGTVAGKRYFHCRPLHGLFAPLHKVKLVSKPASTTPSTPTTPSKLTSETTRPFHLVRNSLSNSLHQNYVSYRGSQDSISSLGSAASSASRRLKLGVTSLSSRTSSKGKVSVYNSPTISGLQRQLREREEQIEALVRERDLDRTEFVRTAAQVDEVESQLSHMLAEKNRFMQEVEGRMKQSREFIAKLEAQKADLSVSLQEEKRRMEDLQFTLEEVHIEKADLQCQLERDGSRLRGVEARLKEEMASNQALNNKLQHLERRGVAEDSAAEEHLDRIEELTHLLCVANNKLAICQQSLPLGVEMKSVHVCKRCACAVQLEVLECEKKDGEEKEGGENGEENREEEKEGGENREGEKDNGRQEEEDFYKHQHILVSNRRLLREVREAGLEGQCLRSQVQSLQADLQKVSAEKDLIDLEMADLLEDHKRLQEERQKVVAEMEGQRRVVQETAAQVKSFEAMVEKLTAEYTVTLEELKTKHHEALLQVQTLSATEQQCTSLSQQLETVMADKEHLLAEVRKLKSSLLEKNMEHNDSEELKALLAHKENLISQLTLQLKEASLNHQCHELETNLNNGEIKNTTSTTTATAATTTTTATTTTSTNTTASTTTTATANATSDSMKCGVDDSDTHESQLGFLNMVIVDLQSKNTQLQALLQAASSRGSSKGDEGTERVFCEACERWDDHPSHLCPHTPPPSNGVRNHGDPLLRRPYCLTCEVFGHSTEECKCDETY